MKRFKIIDVWISIIFITVGITFGLMYRSPFFILGYLLVGGWQIISMAVHTVKGWFIHKGGKRQNYHILVLMIIAFSLLSLLANELVMNMYPLFFISPLMASYYTYLCYHETFIKMKRPLDQLK